MAVNQEMLMQIVSLDMGFDVEAISEALQITGNSSVEDAINYLFTKQTSAQEVASPSEPHASSTSTVDELKDRFRDLDLNIPNDKVHEALQRHNNNPHQAFEWLLSELQHGRIKDENDSAAAGAVRPIRSEEDREAVKVQMQKKAEERRQQQMEDERNRQAALEEERRRFEAEAKEREEKAAIHAEAVKANRQKIQQRKKADKKKANARRLEWHTRQEAYDQKDQDKAATTRARRERDEANLNTGEDCIKILYDRYGEDLVIQILQFIRRILDKVHRNLENDRYRSLDLSTKKASAMLVTPLGSARYLKLVGFEQREDRLIMDSANCNPDRIAEAITLLDKYLTFEDSPVIACIEKCEEEKIDAQDLYFALQVTHEYLRNILISPTNLHLTLIPVDDPHFRNYVGKIRHFVRLFKTIGFSLVTRSEGRFFSIEIDRSMPLNASTHPQLRVLKACVRDCKQQSNQVINETHVVSTVHKLRELNVSSRAFVEKLFGVLLKATQRILDEPLEFKFQKLNLTKLKTKCPGVTGTLSIVKAVGFENKYEEGSSEYATLSSPADFELLKFKRALLEYGVTHPKRIVNGTTATEAS